MLGDPAPIQYLAVDSNGSTLYFTTSLRQRGTSQSAISKVFALSSAGLQLVEQSSFNSLLPGAPVYTRPSVSGDDAVLAINWYPHYDCGSACSILEIPASILRTAGGDTKYRGFACVSPNGRFVLFSGIPVGLPSLPPPVVQSQLLDLTTGNMTVIPPQPAGAGRVVANDGTVLLQNGGHVQLVGPGGTVSLAPAAAINNVQLAADASRIVYDNYKTIHVLDVGSGSDRQLASGYFPILAGDGRTFSYLNPKPGVALAYNSVNQVWLGDAISGIVTQLTNESDGITEQVITADGSKVFAATATGRVLSIDLSSGLVTQLLNSAPSRFLSLEWPAVPGSFNWVAGSSDISLQLRIGSAPAIVLGASSQPAAVAIQVPWEVQPDPSADVTLWGTEPAWELVLSTGVAAMNAVPIGLDTVGDYAIHQDWSGVVTVSDPARPGETVHVYGTGWGAVDGTVQSGMPTPTDRLYNITAPCQWSALSAPFNSKAAEYSFTVQFSGLAPSLVGLYQLDFLIPPGWSFPIFNPICRIGSNYTVMGTIPVARSTP
jgi:uncharacterized protein (TIGR03437 family)